MKPIKPSSAAGLLSIAMGLCLASGSAVAKAPPTINLFPLDVVETMKSTTESAKQLETNLIAVVDRLKVQTEMFTASQCDGENGDPGCQQLRANLASNYRELLDRVEESLPAIDESVSRLVAGLGKRLKQDIGLKFTPRDLERTLQSSPGARQKLRQNQTGKRGAGRMSELFNQYYQLVTRSRSGGTVPTMAADIYLDAMEVKETLALMRDEIAAAKVEAEIMQAYSGLTPQMMAVVEQVKGLVYGESDDSLLPLPPEQNTLNPNVASLLAD